MKESGVVCKKKKAYLLSLLLFLISYLITVVNMVVNIITGGFHLYIFSILSFMLPCYKSIKAADVFGIVLTILLLLISFLLIFFTVKYDQSKRPLCYMSLILWYCITQILSLWILADSHLQNYIYFCIFIYVFHYFLHNFIIYCYTPLCWFSITAMQKNCTSFIRII